MESKDRKDHGVGDVDMVKLDLTAQGVISDDEHAYPGEPEDEPEDDTDAAEDGNVDRNIPPEEKNETILDDLTYFPKLRRTERQARQKQCYWYKLGCVTIDLDGYGEVPNFYGKAMTRSDSARRMMQCDLRLTF